MNLRNLKEADIKNKTILYRSPYDIGTKEVDGKFILKDSSRIKATIPTLKYLLEQNCKIVIITWVGRPEGKDKSLSTKAHAEVLANLLNHPVKHVNDCIGKLVDQEISQMQNGDILMLENTRYYKEDYEENDEFAKELTKGKDIIVYDGFPQAHRAVSSTTGILKLLPSYPGFYFTNEIENLSGLLDNPVRPFTLIIGGAKISDKVGAIENLIDKVDHVLVGGGPANAFLQHQGMDMEGSLIEKDLDGKLGGLMDRLLETNKIVLPIDLKYSNDAPRKALDIGKQTQDKFKDIIEKSETIFWAGPMGVFEKDDFSAGTKAVAEAMESISAKTIIAGGDTIAALNKLGNSQKIGYISLAGGATLEFLAGKELPVIEYLR